MTTNDLDAITARTDAASPGEWSCFDENNGEGPERHWTVSNDVWAGSNDTPEGAAAMHSDEWLSRADAEFIAHARADVPALVDEVRELRELVAAIRSTGGLPIDEWWQAIRQLIRDRDAQEAVDLVAATTGPGSEPCS